MRESAHEPGRVDGRTVRRVEGATCELRADTRAALAGVEPAVVLVAEAPAPEMRELFAHLVHLGLGRGESDRTAFGVVALDALVAADASDFVDRVEHRVLERDAFGPTPGALEQTFDSGQPRGAPATVAARRPVPGDARLDHCDRELGAQRGQVVGGPEAGVAGADDGDVHVA